MIPINTHIPLDVHIHQHDGDPDGECEVSVGGGDTVKCPAAAIGGMVRAKVLERIKDLDD